MPRAPKRPCSAPSCPVLVEGKDSRCPVHQKEYNDAYNARRRAERAWGFYSTPEWRKLREVVKAEEPLCRVCGVRATVDIDHIIPRLEAPGLALVRSNLRGLCRQCHGRMGRKAKGQTGLA